MREKRRWKSEWLKGFSEKCGLREDAEILVRERSMLKDGSYITREWRTGVVLKLYPYHFYCLMSDGSKESFRYNEFLGYESRLVRLKESAEGNMSDKQLNQIEKASGMDAFLLRRRWDSNPRTLADQTISSRLCYSSENGSCWKIEEVEGSESLEISMFF